MCLPLGNPELANQFPNLLLINLIANADDNKNVVELVKIANIVKQVICRPSVGDEQEHVVPLVIVVA